MEPKVIFEDNSILILDKPSGWITNKAATTKKTPVVQVWLSDNYEFDTTKENKLRSGIVHRLDKETSGILVVAKTKKAFFNIQAQFKERTVKKSYVALVHGLVELPKGNIIAPVGRLPWNRERFGVIPGGRKAETDYIIKSKITASPASRQSPKSKEMFTLLVLYPKTGRTHQIRIHLKFIGHPIVADEFYAGRKTAREDRKWCSRLFLHASEISFNHPNTGKRVKFKSKLPEDLQNFMESLIKSRKS